MILARYSVLLTPGWLLFWWLSATWLLLNWLVTVARLSSICSPFLCRSSHLCGTLVRLSARIWQDFTSVMSIVSMYSSIKARSVPKRRFTSILLAAFVFTCAFSVRVSDTHRCTHAELVTTCNTRACHWRARLSPSITASSSARLMYRASLIGRNQQASSTMLSFTPSATPVAMELASTQTLISSPSMHLSPLTRSNSYSSHCFYQHTTESSLISSLQLLAYLLGA